MGTDLNRPVFVELYGMPGCGKTTVSHACAQALRQAGYRVLEPNYDLVHGRGGALMRQVRKLLRTASYLCTHPGQIARIRQLVSRNGYTGFRDVIRQTVNIVQKLWVYHAAGQQAGIWIWDQGIVQCAVSLAIPGKESSAANEEALWALCPPAQTLRILVTIQEDMLRQRLDGRSTANSRLEQQKDPGAWEQMLCAFRDACRDIKDPAAAIDNSGSSPEAAVRELTEAICRCLEE